MRLVIVLLVAVLQGSAQAAGQPTFQELEESLTCQCGCGLTVHACNHLQCPSALPLRQELREQMGLGLDRTQILAHFEQRYGEKILSSPTTSGFNLTAWTMPFITLRHAVRRADVAPLAPCRPARAGRPATDDRPAHRRADRRRALARARARAVRPLTDCT